MAFGQPSGPPAAARRVAELAELLAARGYDSFKEARHPFGLTQRQASGKFTTAEVDELIQRLEADADADTEVEGHGGTADDALGSPPDRHRLAREEELVVGLDAEVMATELTNRGWCCIPPPD